MNKDEALKLALEAIEEIHRTGDTQVFDMYYAKPAIAAIKEALAQPEQEPVAKVVSTAPAKIWLDLGFDPHEDEVSFDDLIDVTWSHDNATSYGIEYVRVDTNPPKRTWVGLTDEEISAASKGHITRNGFARVVEAKLKEKNT